MSKIYRKINNQGNENDPRSNAGIKKLNSVFWPLSK